MGASECHLHAEDGSGARIYEGDPMLISYFSPNEHHRLFAPHVKNHRFLHNRCTKDADLIYCGSASQLDKAMVAKREYGKPLICWVWDLPYCWPEWARNNEEVRAHAWRDKYIETTVSNLRQCDKVISASKHTQRVLRERYGIESEQIYFYIDMEGIDAIPPNGKSGHIIQISRFALNKRFDISIKATSTIDRKLICVGTGGYVGLKRLAENLHADVDFYCNENNRKVIGLLKSAVVLVSPSLHEGWGMTPIEALYCGVPVLLSDLEVFREIYGDSVPYHRKDDVDDMSEKLRYLLADTHLQRKIVEGCQPLISDFTIPKFIERWEKMIRRIEWYVH